MERIEEAQAIQVQQPNEPLTLQELLRMDGEQVLVCTGSGKNGWRAYRSKPEQEDEIIIA